MNNNHNSDSKYKKTKKIKTRYKAGKKNKEQESSSFSGVSWGLVARGKGRTHKGVGSNDMVALVF